MTSLDALKRTQRFRMTGDFEADRLRDMQEEDQIGQGDAAQKAEMARLENRAIMRDEMAQREETAKRPQGFAGSLTTIGGTSPTETAKYGPQGKWGKFYDNEAIRGNEMALAGEGMPSPGGAHLLGRGDTERTPLDSLAALASNRTPVGGGAVGGGSSARSGEVTYSPGGNYSRGPAMDDFDTERLKQERAKTTTLEQNVPSVAMDRERNEEGFRRNTGIDAAQARHEGEMGGLKSGSQKALEAQISAHTMLNDPDVWRAAELQRKWAIEGQQPKVDIAQTKASADVQRAEIAAWARTEAEKIKGDASQKIAVARLVEESLADAGNAYSTEDQLRLRAFADALKGQSSLLSPGAASLVKGPQ